MFTIILAWINAKYKHDYADLFLGTFVIDILIIISIFDILSC